MHCMFHVAGATLVIDDFLLGHPTCTSRIPMDNLTRQHPRTHSSTAQAHSTLHRPTLSAVVSLTRMLAAAAAAAAWTPRCECSTSDRNRSVGSTDATGGNSPPLATCFAISGRSRAHQRNLTAPSAAQNLHERQHGMDISHMTSVRSSDDLRKGNHHELMTTTMMMTMARDGKRWLLVGFGFKQRRSITKMFQGFESCGSWVLLMID